MIKGWIKNINFASRNDINIIKCVRKYNISFPKKQIYQIILSKIAMEMVSLNDEFYAELAQELVYQICDNRVSDGVIELKVDVKKDAPPAEIVFAFNNADYTLQCGINSLSYLLLAFCGGVRCSTDFEVSKLETKIDA